MTQFTYQERFKTAQGVFDEHTNRTLFELHSRDHFEELISPIKVGKESNVFVARQAGKTVIVKIYRVQNADFKRMYAYIRKDPRYTYLQQQRRQIIFAWTQREYKNLLRAQEAGILAPKPVAFLDNVIVEELIGKTTPAPALKDALPENPQLFFDTVIKQIQKLYQAGLIHGDLSSFNILNYEEHPYFIDFSQATLTKTPNSLELLERDIKNILHFFGKLKVKADFENIFKRITGTSYHG